jgi:hypothetical protein
MTAPTQYRVRNWSQFQHYKDRSPEWIKLHFAILASEDWAMLADASKLLAVVCMLVASRHGGMVPNKPAYLKRVAYLDEEPDLAPLISCGFLENPLADASKVEPMQADACLDKRRGEEKREDKSSEPNGSGARAPSGVVAFDARKQLFDEGLPLLARATGRPEQSLRSVVGKWLKAVNDDAERLTRVIAETVRDRRADPVSWIERSLKPADPDAAIYRNVL